MSGHSITFHGRDLFAPAAAQLAAELIDWADLGPPVLDVVRLPNLKAVQGRGGQWAGTILSVDRFGNVITNLPSRIGLSPGFAVTAAGHEIRQFRRTFGEAAPANSLSTPAAQAITRSESINRARRKDRGRPGPSGTAGGKCLIWEDQTLPVEVHSSIRLTGSGGCRAHCDGSRR